MKKVSYVRHLGLAAVCGSLVLTACGGGSNNGGSITTTPRACAEVFDDSALLAFTNDGDAQIFLSRELTGAGADAPLSLEVTGLNASETVIGADFNPKNDQIIAVTNTGRFLRGVIQGDCDDDDGTTVAFQALNNVPVGSATALPFTTTPAERVSISFNPTVNAFRILKGDDTNLRAVLTADGSEVMSLTTDTALTYTAGDDNAGRTVSAVDLAYTNQRLTAGAVPTETAVYALDFKPDMDLVLSRLGGPAAVENTSPNGGVLVTASTNVEDPDPLLPPVAGPFLDIDPERSNTVFIVGGDDNCPELFSSTVTQFETTPFVSTELGSIFCNEATRRVTAFTVVPTAALNNVELSTLTPAPAASPAPATTPDPVPTPDPTPVSVPTPQ